VQEQPRPGREFESKLLRDIGRLADKLRELRRTNAVANEAQIKTITADMRSKWDELRSSRAGTRSGPGAAPAERRSRWH
jgi:hypothetical protein